MRRAVSVCHTERITGAQHRQQKATKHRTPCRLHCCRRHATATTIPVNTQTQLHPSHSNSDTIAKPWSGRLPHRPLQPPPLYSHSHSPPPELQEGSHNGRHLPHPPRPHRWHLQERPRAQLSLERPGATRDCRVISRLICARGPHPGSRGPGFLRTWASVGVGGGG